MCGPAAGGLTHPGWCWHVQAGQMMASTGPGEFPGEAAAASARTSPVGSFPADGDGRSDMIGNVWEWCANATGPVSGAHRALRRSSWYNYGTDSPRCAYPSSKCLDTYLHTHGFRCVVPADK